MTVPRPKRTTKKDDQDVDSRGKRGGASSSRQGMFVGEAGSAQEEADDRQDVEDCLEDINTLAGDFCNPPDTSLSEHDMSELVSDVMRLILAQNQKRPNVPIPYLQIQKRIKELQRTQKGIAKAVIAHAQKQFLRFGWHLTELANEGGQVTGYVMRTCLPCSFVAQWINSPQDNCLAGLKYQIQLFLHLKGDSTTEADLRAHLAKLGLHLKPMTDKNAGGAQVAALFGTNNPLATLVEQKFLKEARVEGADGSMEDVLVRGEAAYDAVAELSKDDVEDDIKKLAEEA